MPSSLSVKNSEEPLNHSNLTFKVKSSVSSPLDFGVHQMKLQYTKRQLNGFVLDATTTYDILLGDSLRRLCWRYPSECMQTSSHVARGLYILCTATHFRGRAASSMLVLVNLFYMSLIVATGIINVPD